MCFDVYVFVDWSFHFVYIIIMEFYVKYNSQIRKCVERQDIEDYNRE